MTRSPKLRGPAPFLVALNDPSSNPQEQYENIKQQSAEAKP